jgi:hypothetical protein
MFHFLNFKSYKFGANCVATMQSPVYANPTHSATPTRRSPRLIAIQNAVQTPRNSPSSTSLRHSMHLSRKRDANTPDHRPGKRRFVLLSPPDILCAHKASRCALESCLRCSKCCPHAVPKRPRGRPKRATPRAKKMSRKAHTNLNYQLLQSPAVIQSEVRISTGLPNFQEILHFFGLDAEYWQKHMPSQTRRSSNEFWQNDHANYHQAVVNYYKMIIQRVAEALCGPAGEASLSRLFASENAEGSSLLTSLASAIEPTTKGSVERRVLRAVVCDAFSLTELQSATETFPVWKMSRDTYTNARKDYELLRRDGKIPTVVRSRARFNASAVDSCISHILSFANVSYLSWGTKKIRLNGVRHDAPSLLRKKPISVIYRDYLLENGVHEDEVTRDHVGQRAGCVSRASFYRIIKMLTNGELQVRSCVDYVAGFLVYDAFDQLREIIQKLLPEICDVYESKLEAVMAWLKYAHAGSSQHSDCPRHLIKFGLSKPARSTVSSPVTCAACRSLHKLFVHLKQLIAQVDAHPSALQVVSDIEHKIQLFMGHRLRVVNQQLAFENLISSMEEDATINAVDIDRYDKLDAALIVIDFKMKAEPIYYREKTSDHFGKRGMSWHGVLVRYWEYVMVLNGTAYKKMESRLYYDHISSGDNKQDKVAVLSMIEAAIMAIKRDLPHIRRITVQSDNASSYQNASVIIFLPLIGVAHGITVERFLHTETQDGKSMLDAHFGQATRKIWRYVQQGHNCVTPSQLVFALSSDGGLPNCLSELIEYDRAGVEVLLKQSANLEKMFTKIAGRANDIQYEYVSAPITAPFSFTSCPDFTIRVFHYSGISDGDLIDISPSRGVCSIRAAIPNLQRTLFAEEYASDLEDAGSFEIEEGIEDDEDASDEQCDVENHCNGEINVESSDDEMCSSDCDGDDENVSRGLSQGIVTRVSITTESQIRRRVRKWKNAPIIETNLSIQVTDQEYDLIAYAKKCLLSLKGSGKMRIVESTGLSQEIVAVTSSLDIDLTNHPLPSLSVGWARRPSRGQMYGAKYVHLYEADIREMFEQGVAMSAQKLGAGRMVQLLKEKYPNRFDLPSESEVKTEISKLFAASKKRNASAREASAQPRRARFHMHVGVNDYIKTLIEADPAIKPRQVIEAVRSTFPNSLEAAPNDKIRAKVSYLKRIHTRR